MNTTTNETSCEAVPKCPEDLACALPLCKEGEVIEIPPGECCLVCTRPDCAAVLCLTLTEEDCEEGETLVTPPGECCARCQPKLDCSTVLCRNPLCPRGQSPQVPEGQCCPVCVKDGKFYLNADAVTCENMTVLLSPCTQTECPIRGQVVSDCASACPATCDSDPNQICILVCKQGCTCPPGQVIDTANNRCVERENCPAPGELAFSKMCYDLTYH